MRWTQVDGVTLHDGTPRADFRGDFRFSSSSTRAHARSSFSTIASRVSSKRAGDFDRRFCSVVTLPSSSTRRSSFNCAVRRYTGACATMDVPRCDSTASRTFLATRRRGSRREHCSVVSTVSSSPVWKATSESNSRDPRLKDTGRDHQRCPRNRDTIPGTVPLHHQHRSVAASRRRRTIP